MRIVKSLTCFALLLMAASVAPAQAQEADTGAAVSNTDVQQGASATDDVDAPGGSRRSYIVPTFRFMQTVDSNAQLASQESGVEAGSIISGDLTLQHVWRRALLNATYQGGASFYTNSSQTNTSFHSLGLRQTFTGRRWALSFGDQFSYLPDSAFGFSGFGLTSGTQRPYGTDPITSPLQSILTPYSNRYENTVDASWQYRVSARDSISFAGSYGLLRFTESGYMDSDSYGASASYGHQIGKRSSLGLAYSANLVRYVHMDAPMDSHAVQVEFKHSLTKRYALQLAAGPQYASYFVGGQTRESWNPSVRAGLSGTWSRTNVGLMYHKAVTAGSGIMQGSKTDTVMFNVTRRLNRDWTGTATAGYAHNSQLQHMASLGYDSVSTGVSLSRRLWRDANFFLQYNLQRQDIASGTASPLAGNLVRHVFGIGFTWNLRHMPGN